MGGAIGTNIDPFTCPRGDGASAPAAACAGAWALMRITKQATAYLENVWGQCTVLLLMLLLFVLWP